MGDRYIEVTPIAPPYEGPAVLMPFAHHPDATEPDNMLLLTPEDAAKVSELVAAGSGCVRVRWSKDGKSLRFSLVASVQ